MSSTPVVTATEICLVRDGEPLSLEVVIGDEQAGGTSAIWRGAIMDVPNSPALFPLANDGGTVRTATLHCATRVRDINQNTNRTSVTYILRCGLSETSYPFEVMAPEWDYAEYVIDFVFI